MKADAEIPEIGIQLLKKYHSQGIGTRVVNLFVNQLKSIINVEFFTVRIRSDNYASQRMFEKMGAIKVGEEGKEYADLMYELMQRMGKENLKRRYRKSLKGYKRIHYAISYQCNI